MAITVQIISITELLDLNDQAEVKLIGRFTDDVEALKIAEQKQPAIILLDYDIEKENTALYIKSLIIESPDSKVILLGNKLLDEVVLSCLVNGSYGYLEWVDTEKFLIKTVLAVGRGEAWVSRRLVGLLIERFRD